MGAAGLQRICQLDGSHLFHAKQTWGAMTQVVGMVFRGLAFQGSDRRLSTGSTLTPVSDRASKSIVVSTNEAIGLVGYTGLAEVPIRDYGLVQMDSLLAGACCNEPEWPWKPPASDNDLGVLQMGQVAGRIADWLTLLRLRIPAGLKEHVRRQTVQIVGFRRDSKMHARPFSFVVAWDRGRDSFAFRGQRLDVEQLVSPHVTLTPPRPGDSSRRIAEFLSRFDEDPPTMMDGFARCLSGFTHIPGVGGEFLMLVWEPLEFTIHTHFVNPTGEHPVVVTPDGDVAVTPLPWLVAPGLAAPPTLTNFEHAGFEQGLHFLTGGPLEGPPTLIKIPLSRARKVGPQRYQLPLDVLSGEGWLSAGPHTFEIVEMPRPEWHL